MITDEWIKAALASPLRTEAQDDGRIKVSGKVDEADGKVLRIVLLEDKDTVHNAFFDRNYKG